MEDLKIKVNSESESREVQELFFELGYTWSSDIKDIFHFDIPEYIVNWNNGYITVGDDFDKNRQEITLPELRGMVASQYSNDEPFLTPECTLNDQYAEIEQVRQQTIEATLAERQGQYGCYEDVAHITQEILKALRISGYDRMPATHKESMHMIASKMARLVCGDCNHSDSWHDIAGYAKLVEDII